MLTKIFGTMTAMKTYNESDFSHNYRSELEAPPPPGAAFNWDCIVHNIW